ncbi:hypothetical protein HPB52_017084 [Rhipicephalus sanguineus]|uniref:Tigger transposable element-derived protein 4 n=1 Tax=Rhipicephalus sanguineus TaxID=34632 RepID=A0A9D4QDY6_RHISA|nr:hypothetical protein HPB52_017084 [Rhipicephalus sanguineus]
MGRLDTSLMVRQASLHVWKVVVTNTPRTLREILPTLFSLLLGFLASSSYDKQQVAARTLGDLVRKLGERVLPEIVPILEQGLDSDLPDQRQGVCVGLSEILASTSRDMVLTFLDSLVPTVRRALCDPLKEVRVAAAKTFDNLHSTVGSRALDDILSPLLMQLGHGDSELAENTLDGLRQVMAIKSRVVLPYLIPQVPARFFHPRPALSGLFCAERAMFALARRKSHRGADSPPRDSFRGVYFTLLLHALLRYGGAFLTNHFIILVNMPAAPCYAGGFTDRQVKMTPPVPARKCLTLEQKVQLIREVEKEGRQKSEIARQFGIPPSTLSTVLKNKNAVLDGFEKSFSAKRKRNRDSMYPEVERALLEWLKNARSANLPVNGPALTANAEALAAQMGKQDFKCSRGWLERFERRHGVSSKSIVGESAAVDRDIVDGWCKHRLSALLQQYEDRERHL